MRKIACKALKSGKVSGDFAYAVGLSNRISASAFALYDLLAADWAVTWTRCKANSGSNSAAIDCVRKIALDAGAKVYRLPGRFCTPYDQICRLDLGKICQMAV